MGKMFRLYVLSLLFIPYSAYSALLYDESVDGDSSFTYSLAPIVRLEPGSNTLIGSSLWPLNEDRDTDGFVLIVPEGSYLTTIFLKYASENLSSIFWEIIPLDDFYADRPSATVYPGLTGDASSIELFSALNLAPNTDGYWLVGGAGGKGWADAYLDYEFDLLVGPDPVLVPVPIPPASVLMLSGLLGLFSAGRRRVLGRCK